jgi:Tfp pilus assembly protein PilO
MDLQDPRTQKLILGGIVFLGLAYGYYSLVYSGQQEKIAVLQGRLVRIERHVERAKARVERHNIADLQAQLSAHEARLSTLETLLPKAEEVPDLLEMVERKGIQTGVNSILFEPAGSREGDLYTEQVYKVSVRGGYNRVGVFLSRKLSEDRKDRQDDDPPGEADGPKGGVGGNGEL